MPENQENKKNEEKTEVTLIHAMIALVNAVEASAITGAHRADELLIVREFIDQNTPDKKTTTDDLIDVD